MSFDPITLQLAKNYTDEKVGENDGSSIDLSNYYTKKEIDDMDFVTSDELPEGGVIDKTLTIEGQAADAKATGDRLLGVEYQTVTTEPAFEHTGLPEGEKTVTINNDGSWGDTAYICTGKDLIPRKTFNCTFPYNGITITRSGSVYHIEGTNTSTSQTAFYFAQSKGDIRIEIDESLVGKTLKLLTFAQEIIGSGLGLVVDFRDSDAVQLSRKSMYFAKANSYNSSTVVVPENTSYMMVTLTVTANTTLNHDIQAYIVVDEDTQSIDLNNSLVADVDNTVTELLTFPHQSTVLTKLSLVEYIDYTADNSDGGTVTYLTPEDFGAIGDGYADDNIPISLCLATAATTKQTVLMAKKYYISNPIDINCSGLQAIINDVVYDGDDAAIIIHGRQNTLNIHSITSSAVGVRFVGDSDVYCCWNTLDVNTITSGSHGIEFTATSTGVYQNTVKFNYIRAGGDGCHGITRPNLEEDFWCTENNFYGGQVSNCDWAIYNIGGTSKLYGIQVETDVKGGFYITGSVMIYAPRWAESSRDGEYPFLKFASTKDPAYVVIDSGVSLSIWDIDLSENIDTFTGDSDTVYPLKESKISTLNFPIIPSRLQDGDDVATSAVYCTKAYVWGKFLIMTPHMAYRKEVTTSSLDTRLIGQETIVAEINALTQLPTKFVVNTVNTDIYLHESYCAFGFNEFEVEQANGFTCKVYDKLDNLIFDGTELGDGVYKFNVYKDATYCANNSSGSLRRDFLGHYWQVTKETTVNDVLAALPTWSGGAY